MVSYSTSATSAKCYYIAATSVLPRRVFFNPISRRLRYLTQEPRRAHVTEVGVATDEPKAALGVFNLPRRPFVRISEVMNPNVQIARPHETIHEAAKVMGQSDIGALPVAENDRLVGMITDRDIAIRAVAENKPPSTKVREVMTIDVKFCYDDETISQVALNMGDNQVRRLPVVNREMRLVGILALGDLATQGEKWSAVQALEGISKPNQQDTPELM